MSDETILVVDDNHEIADFLAETVLPSLGYKTLVAYNAGSALDLIRTKDISLMVLDLQLPDMSGLDLLRQMAKDGRSLPTILSTAHGSEEVAVDAFRLGVQDYLPKPVDTYGLERALTRALAETRWGREKAVLSAQLKDRVSWLTVLTKIGQSLTSTLDLDEVLRRIVEAGVYLTRAEEGFLALLDGESGQLYVRAAKNLDEKVIKSVRIPVTDSLVGSVMRTGRPVRTAREADGSPLKVSTGFLVNNLLHVPIASKGKALGVLSVDNRNNVREFSQADEAQLTSLAGYAAVSIENAQLYERAQQEINERIRMEQALRESEERFALAVRGANDGLWDWDLRTNQIYFSPRWKAMLGFGEHENENNPEEWFSRVHPEDIERLKLDISSHLKGVTSHFENEHRMLHRDGDYRWMLSRGLAVWDANRVSSRMAGSQTDITDRKKAEQQLLHDAFHDALTGLPNRALFLDRLKYAIERAKRREDYEFAVLFLDLDRFKDINDSLGHLTGDQLLIEIARMLRVGMRTTDTVARLGGDEFVILLEDIEDTKAATRVANWINERLASAFNLVEREVYITTSIGIVLGITGYREPEEVLRDADIAMYSAKASGRARYEIFEPNMRERILDRVSLESDLRQAIEHHELRVYYQPIVSLLDGKIIGLEALVRWEHPRRGLLFPMDFLPMAEETGLIIPIDRWVLGEACRQMKEWQLQIPSNPPLTVSVNFSGKHLNQPDLVNYIQSVLEETGLDPGSLKLEITETTIMENNQQTSSMFNELQSLGVQLQIDDFGIGYSSLGYLSNFPINALKIDRTFVGKMGEDTNKTDIVQAIVMLTDRLGVGVIAEGVETEAQLAKLKELGCEFGQGYLVSIPLESEAIQRLLAEASKDGYVLMPWKREKAG